MIAAEHIRFTVSLHEAAHAVSAELYGVPHLGITLNPPPNSGYAGGFLFDLGPAWAVLHELQKAHPERLGRAFTHIALSILIAEHADLEYCAVFGITKEEAAARAAGDKPLLEREIFDRFKVPADARSQITHNAAVVAEQLVKNPAFRAAVHSVAHMLCEGNGELDRAAIQSVVEKTGLQRHSMSA